MGCEGEPIELQDYMPKEMQELRKKITAYTSGKLGQTAEAMPEDMPLSAPVNELQLNAAQMMNQLLGAGQFSMPPYRTGGGWGSSGGGGGGNIGGGNNPKIRGTDNRTGYKSLVTNWGGPHWNIDPSTEGQYWTDISTTPQGGSLLPIPPNQPPPGAGPQDQMAALWQAAMRNQNFNPYLPSNYT